MNLSPDPPRASRPCKRCGHPEEKHLFNAATPYPSEGWVTCSVPGCDCYGTWSLDAESKAAMDKFRAEYLQREGGRAAESGGAPASR